MRRDKCVDSVYVKVKQGVRLGGAGLKKKHMGINGYMGNIMRNE